MIRPLRDRIVVKPDPLAAHVSELIILRARAAITASREQFGRTGTVLAVGPGKQGKHGTRSLQIEPGAKILFGEWEYPTVDENGSEQVLVLQEADIIGVIE